MPVTDPERWFGLVEARFGIAPAVFEGYTLFQPNARYLSLVASDHRPPARPEAVFSGLYFLKVAMRYPKLTTQAAMVFGGAATRNVVTLDEAGIAAYIRRNDVALTPEQTASCDGMGYVLVRYGGFTTGVGLFRPEGDAGRLESLFPGNWGGIRNEDVRIG